MTRAHRQRGVATELLAVKALRDLGWPGAERTVRTGYRNGDRELPDLGDIDGTPGIVWQVKSLRPANAAERMVPAWMIETEQQRVAARAVLGVLIVRREYAVPAQWWAFLPAVDLYGLADGFSGASTPAALEGARDRAVLMPVRFTLADLAELLRGQGFGDELEAAS